MKYLKFGEISAQVVAWTIFVTACVLVLEGQASFHMTLESTALQQMIFKAHLYFRIYLRPIFILLLIKGICEVFYWIVQMGKSRL